MVQKNETDFLDESAYLNPKNVLDLEKIQNELDKLASNLES